MGLYCTQCGKRRVSCVCPRRLYAANRQLEMLINELITSGPPPIIGVPYHDYYCHMMTAFKAAEPELSKPIEPVRALVTTPARPVEPAAPVRTYSCKTCKIVSTKPLGSK